MVIFCRFIVYINFTKHFLSICDGTFKIYNILGEPFTVGGLGERHFSFALLIFDRNFVEERKNYRIGHI